MKQKKEIICNVDTGIDDALAIGLALVDENINLRLLTSSAGNSSLEHTTHNTLNILQWFGANVPVAKGNVEVKNPETKNLHIHGGRTGLGNFVFPPLKLKPIEQNAVEAMFDLLQKSKHKITIVCISPATDLMTLLQLHPDIKDKIDKIVLQSGLMSDTEYKSFNMWCDIDACEYLLQSGVPILICPSDLGHIAHLDEDEVDYVRNFNKTGKMFAIMFQSFKDRICQNKVAMHDSTALACVSHPEFFKTVPAFVSIAPNNANFVFDFDCKKQKPNCNVCKEIDIQKFKQYAFSELKKTF